jgi:hypothetical protein
VWRRSVSAYRVGAGCDHHFFTFASFVKFAGATLTIEETLVGSNLLRCTGSVTFLLQTMSLHLEPVWGLGILAESDSLERRMCNCIHMLWDTRCVIQTKFSCDPHALHARSCNKMEYKVRRFFKLLTSTNTNTIAYLSHTVNKPRTAWSHRPQRKA